MCGAYRSAAEAKAAGADPAWYAISQSLFPTQTDTAPWPSDEPAKKGPAPRPFVAPPLPGQSSLTATAAGRADNRQSAAQLSTNSTLLSGPASKPLPSPSAQGQTLLNNIGVRYTGDPKTLLGQ